MRDGTEAGRLSRLVLQDNEAVINPHRLACYEMAEADLDLGLSFTQHAREKLVGDECHVFGKEEVLHRCSLNLVQVSQSDHLHCRGVAINRHKFHVTCAKEFAADFRQRNQVLHADFRLLSSGFRQLKSVCRLMYRRCETCQTFENTGVLSIEMIVGAVLDRPHRADRNAAEVKGGKKPLTDAGFCLQQCRKRPFGIFHQQDRLPRNDFIARTGFTRHRAVAKGRPDSGFRDPTKFAIRRTRVEKADPS